MQIQIQYFSVDKLIPYSRNVRKNDHVLGRMVALIDEYGFKIPILARSNGEVVDGHLRLKAARKRGMTEVPVILCDEWSEAQVKAFRLAVNRSVSWAEWDETLVALEIVELKALDFDLNLTGFDPIEIDELLFRDGDEGQEDAVPEAPESAVTRLGDLWLCGSAISASNATFEPHRVLCGDATSPEAVSTLFSTVTPTLLVTDPPYGVDYDPNWRERAGLGRQRQTGTILNDDRVDWSQAYRLFLGDVAYVWHAGVHASEVAAGLEAVGMRIRAQIIWAKQHFALGRGDYHWQHEPCWYAVREGKCSHWCGDRSQATLWQVSNLNPFGGSREEPATGHGAQKPVELMRRPILNNTRSGEVVYDPFLGSGTTLIAAQLTDRICYGLEIDPRYADVVVTRWQNLTGCKAKLEGDGRTFDEIAAERTPATVEGSL
jgi:DNA modification methylase